MTRQDKRFLSIMARATRDGLFSPQYLSDTMERIIDKERAKVNALVANITDRPKVQRYNVRSIR